MTEKQTRFVDEYLATGNASEAARRAGYSKQYADVIGSQNLVKLGKEIAERREKLELTRLLSIKEAQEHIAKVVRGQVTETVVTQSGKKIKVPVREADKLRALDMYFKIQGSYREQVEVKLSGAEVFKQTLEKLWNES
ncbi:MAG: terminase small subunit [Selenomonadaceae bacterium]|nr:terminase small subunit [Selenomonadaceae bacterium]